MHRLESNWIQLFFFVFLYSNKKDIGLINFAKFTRFIGLPPSI